MAEIRPFRGIRYAQSKAGDLAKLICPPYDIISPEMQQELHRQSEYNFVRVEYPFEAEDKYQRAAAVLQGWLRLGVLQADDKPAIYVHDHSFPHEGKTLRRRHIMARVRLEEWEKRVVRPHEGIIPRAKSDRLSLLWAVQANTSPVLAMYQDRQGQVVAVLEQATKHPPVMSFSQGQERHQLWALTDARSVAQIQQGLAPEPFYIADGHHRYESALTYRRERLACVDVVDEDAALNFVLMALVDFADPGLVILPPHRLVRGLSQAALHGLMPKLAFFFDIIELPADTAADWQKVDAALRQSGEDDIRLAVFGLTAKRVLLLKLRDFADASRMMPAFNSDLYKKLDVSVVDHVILEQLTELNGKQEIELGYSHSREDAVSRVWSGEYQLTFLLSPVRAETVKAIADAGDRMPRKSTYFYPKAPAGLVVNSLTD